MELIHLGNGRMSLELGDMPVAAILRELNAIRGTRTEQVADVLVIHTSSGRLILTDDWSEPSLISTTLEGDLLLELLAAKLTPLVEPARQRGKLRGNVAAD